MNVRRIAAALFASLLLTSCGPILGQLMKVTEGVKEFQVTQGDLGALSARRNVLVVGPFAKGKGGSYVCRGEDEAAFAEELGAAGLFTAELSLARRTENASETVAALREKTPEDLQRDLRLKQVPDLLLSGTILKRDTLVAPARGLVLGLRYRLDFFDLRTRASTVVEVEVKELSANAIPLVVQELKRQIAARARR